MGIHEAYATFGRRFRTRRMLDCAEAFNFTPALHVLDIGGLWRNWALLPPERRPRLTLLNLATRPAQLPKEIEWMQANALAIPAQPGDFDVVFSNSVIEHVGGWSAQEQFAREIHRLRCPYWVQTPNRYFPVEPHYLGIGVQFLPKRFALPYIQYATLWGWLNHGSATAEAMVREIRLLNEREVRALFPNAEIRRERLGPFVKSLIATGGPD